MRDKGRTENRQMRAAIREESERCLWRGEEGVMRLVTCHSDQARHQTQGALYSLRVSHQDDCRWRLCRLCSVPRPGCRLHQSSGLLQPADTGRPMGARVGIETGQWGTGRCKGWHPSVLSAPSAADTDSGEATCSGVQPGPPVLQSLVSRLRVNNWSSPASVPGIGQVIGLGSAFSLPTVLGLLIGPFMSPYSHVETCVQKDQH